jgi:glycosyltransferase involved in cell wall biosynthesis
VNSPSLLLLIPAHNEEHRLGPVLRDYANYFLEHYRGKFELVVVLNGCQDNTIGVVRAAAAEFPFVRAFEIAEPIGKGGALIEGLKLAPLADVIGYVDADGATPPKAFLELVERIPDADCVIASRWLPGSVLHVEQSNRRQFASRMFHFVVEQLFHLGIRDTQCGAKVMRRQAVEKIHSALCIADMAFDINLLYSLKRAGFRILEVPTEWTDKLGSKVTLFRTSLVMFLSAIRIRLIYSRYHKLLRRLGLGPVEAWVYRKLRAPKPLSSEERVAAGGVYPKQRAPIPSRSSDGNP